MLDCEMENTIKYIIGYIDSYGKIHHHIVKQWDRLDSHNLIWPSKVAAHGKFRWDPKNPNKLNTYNEELIFEEEEKIWEIVDRYGR